jgi:antitoxin HigA-1
VSRKRMPQGVAPPSPGVVLREHILRPERVTQAELADAVGVSRITISQIVNGRQGVTAEMALRLGTATSTTPEFWLNLQRTYDLFEARRRLGPVLQAIRVLRTSPDGTPGTPHVAGRAHGRKRPRG